MSGRPKAKGQADRMLTLQKIIGNTSLHNNSFSACTSGEALDHYIAYAAGMMVVSYSTVSYKQVKYFQAEQAVSAIAFSADGRFLAAGERGRHPLIHVWETKTGILRLKLKAHAFGISCLQFSPDCSRIVSAGFKHDGQICVWNATTGAMLGSQKVQKQIYSLSHSQDGSYFVTCGECHLKFWYYTPAADGSIRLEGKAASILDEHQSVTFLDVACGKAGNASAVYTTTSTGLLCTFSTSRLMERWVQMDAQYAYSVDLTKSSVAVGCDNGIVRLFEPESLSYICTLPQPVPLHVGEDHDYAATTGLRFAGDDKLVCLYADRSTVVWDIHDPHNVSRIRSSVAHRDCIWDVQFVATSSKSDITDVDETLDEELTAPLPEGTFITCAADGTVRMWNTNSQLQRTSRWRSMWSRDMLHMLETTDSTARKLHVDAEQNFLTPENASTGMLDPQVPPHCKSNTIPRCLAIHPSGAEIAIGDREGNLKIYDLETMRLSLTQPAHDAEILTMHYSPPILAGDLDDGKKAVVLLATAGRDRLVHTFDATNNYQHKLTLDNHSASVTAVRFTGDGRRLLSCGGDKTMTLNKVTAHEIQRYASATVPQGTIYGLAVDATNKFAITSGHDKRINIWNIANGRNMRAYKVQGASSEVYKTDTDPASTILAICSFDKHVRLIDFFSGELIEDVAGHSELVTAVRFSPDGEYLISVGGDGCIFVWKVAEELLQQMKSRLMEMYSTMERKKQDSDTSRSSTSGAGKVAKTNVDKRASRGPQVKVNYGDGNSWAGPRVQHASQSDNVTASKNHWAQRLESEGPYHIHGLQSAAAEQRRLDLTVESQVGTMALQPDQPILGSTARSADMLEAHDDVMLGSDDEDDDSNLFEFREKAQSPMDDARASPTPREEHHDSDADTEDYEDDFSKEDGAQGETSTEPKSVDAAKQLDKWLEAELRNESRLDEAVRTSLAQAGQADGDGDKFDSPVKAPAILRQSLSSNFFKEQLDGTPKRPKPAEETPKLPPAQERKQKTASAVAQMRSRLKAMGLLKSLKQPLSAESTTEQEKSTVTSDDSDQKRNARSWRDVEDSTTEGSADSKPSSSFSQLQAPVQLPLYPSLSAPSQTEIQPRPAPPKISPATTPPKQARESDELEDSKSALKDFAAITQRALSAYKDLWESQNASAARLSSQARSLASDKDEARYRQQQEALQEIRQSLTAVHVSLGMILKAPEATLTQTIDTAIERIQDTDATAAEIRPSASAVDLSSSMANQDVAAILEHYSDILIGMVGQKMNSMSTAFSTQDASLSHGDKDLDTSS